MTNVIPYIFALSALAVIMQAAKVPEAAYRRNLAVAALGIVYNVYALWAAGLEAVMGGMLVMGFGWLIWAFIAPRFATPAATVTEAETVWRNAA